MDQDHRAQARELLEEDKTPAPARRPNGIMVSNDTVRKKTSQFVRGDNNYPNIDPAFGDLVTQEL